MNVRTMIFASTFALGALGACKEQPNDGRLEPAPKTSEPSAIGTRPTEPSASATDRPVPIAPTAPTGMPPPSADSPGSATDTRAPIAGASDKGTEAKIGGTTETAPPTTPAATKPRTLASAELKGAKAKGTAAFREESGLTKVLIDVRDVPKGTYQVHVFEGTDCDAISKMETPFAGGPGVAGEGKTGTPGPNTTLALWRSIGAMTVDASGKGSIEVEVKDVKGQSFERRMVVMYPEGGGTKVKQTVVACGPIRTAEALEGEG